MFGEGEAEVNGPHNTEWVLNYDPLNPDPYDPSGFTDESEREIPPGPSSSDSEPDSESSANSGDRSLLFGGEDDRPRQHPCIDIAEMVPADEQPDIDPTLSGFVDGHEPTPIEAGLLAGKSYPTWAAFDRVLDDYEARAGWRFKRVQRNTHRLDAKCRGVDKNNPDACKAYFNVRHLKESGRISIQKAFLIHTCPQGIHKWRHGANKRRWVEDKIESAIKVNQDTSNKSIRGILREDHEADTTKWTAQRARVRVIKRIGGDQSTSFKKIPSYVEKVREADPDTHISYTKYGADDSFRRMYITPASSQNAFKYVRPFVGLDATHSGGEFPMIVLLAATFDCNGQILLLAWGVVGVENKDNWEWFMGHLDDSYLRMRSCRETVIVSDRDKGLIPAAQSIWGSIHHSFCTRHIRANVITNSDKVMGDWFFKELARKVRIVDFEFLLANYKPINSRQQAGLDYIRQIDPKIYARSAFPTPRWGHTTSNVVEILNGVFKDIHKRPTLQICKELWDYTMTKHFNQHQTALSWPTGENALTPRATLMLNTLYARAGGVEERPSSATSALMCDTNGEWAIDIDLRVCECKDWQEMGFPCVHVVKFCRNRGLDEMIYIDDIWKARNQVLAYSIPLPPISLHGLKVSDSCLPPVIVPSDKRMARNLRRRASCFEKTLARERLAAKQRQKCSICHKEGHNCRGCVIPHQSAEVRMNRSSDFLRVCAIHTMDRDQVCAKWVFWDSRPEPKLSFSQWYAEIFPLSQPDQGTNPIP